MRSRMPQRLAISSTNIVAVVRSALGRSPGRTTTVARRRSMRAAGPGCASASIARSDAEPTNPLALRKCLRFISAPHQPDLGYRVAPAGASGIGLAEHAEVEDAVRD